MNYTHKKKNIDRRTNNIVHLKDGSIKYDFSKFNSYIDAIKADYMDCPTDEQIKKLNSLCFSDTLYRQIMFDKLKSRFNTIK